ncbi:MAG: hypothetical protein Q9170_008093 [Blastenia crenularia]
MIPVANNTASPEDSIWNALNETIFRNTIAALAKTSNDLPGESRTYSLSEWDRHHTDPNASQRSLSLDDEQRFADDLAYIAASREGGKAVSAVGLEEHSDSLGITVRLAANRSIPDEVDISEKSCISSIAQIVVKLDRQRIHGRLRSKHWKPLGLKARDGAKEGPLYKGLLALRPKFSRNSNIDEHLECLCETYKKADRNFSDEHEESQFLQTVIQSSFEFCIATTASAGGTSARHQALQSRHIKQIEKLGRYWDFCVFFTKAARRYPEIFKNLKLAPLPAYISVKYPIPGTRKVLKCYVHAEIQLITFYGLMPDMKGYRPRLLGVSKSACYLCDLFVSLHGQYFISKAHGRLYQQWTIPNLANLSTAQRRQYRTILQRMHQICKSFIKSPKVNRLLPPESTHDFHARAVLSPIAATTVTDLSHVTLQDLVPCVQPQGVILNPTHDPANHSDEDLTTRIPDALGASQPASTNGIHECLDVDETPIEDHTPSFGRATPVICQNVITSSSSSLSTIRGDAAELPLHCTITQRDPYSTTLDGVHLYFEIEEPKRGKITLNRDSTRLGNAIDVSTMTPGDILNFYREDGTSIVHLDLCGKSRESVKIDLQWLPDRDTV